MNANNTNRTNNRNNSKPDEGRNANKTFIVYIKYIRILQTQLVYAELMVLGEEGLSGRVAFIATPICCRTKLLHNHHWILSESFYGESGRGNW